MPPRHVNGRLPNGLWGRVRAALGAVLLAAASVLPGAAPARADSATPPAGPATPRTAAPIRLLALGDSLVAGFGLAERQGFTAQLERALRARGLPVTVLNGGVSGDTTTGGLARLDWALADRPDLVLVELGANDALRGTDPTVTRANLDAILKRLTQRGIPTLLAGMYAPPNLGRAYGTAFNSIYPDLAAKYDVPLFPFFLEEVALQPALNQEDGMHPNAAGVARIVETITPQLLHLIERAGLAARAQQG